MLFRIRHNLRYSYAAPALLGPQSLRLRPREDASQHLVDHRLSILPQPSLTSRQLDENGNDETRAWFLGPTASLEVEAESVVETLRVNPFDFVVDPDWARLPWEGRLAETRPGLLASLPAASPEAAGLAKGLLKEAGFEPVAFLLRLNRWIFEHLPCRDRADGAPWTPERTLRAQSGSCRDLAVLFIDACRGLGLPARFVTGYFEADPASRDKDLHAWAEAYIPGGGWRGFDPSCGLAAAERHVALAASPHPEGAAVLSGAFGSAAGESTLKAEVTFG